MSDVPLPDEQVLRAQDQAHAEGHDYVKGSPHLRHPRLRADIEARLSRLVRDAVARTGGCRVLEIGAGHGTFTHTLLAAGATVTVTEASKASAEHLAHEFAGDERVQVVHDESGTFLLDQAARWDLAVLISVVHHIPDYLAFFRGLQDVVAVGGAIFTVQDPLWYPRRSRTSHLVSRGGYFAWRLAQGNYRRGLATRVRRLRGGYSETAESDLVEYHVVRQGCDEQAIEALLAERFDVEVFTYWSHQSPLLQHAFERGRLRSDFGVEATRRRRPD
ncbi:class I SAM-dependent methyltransferase [Nocardioides halotolerans]|jgi:cyclopropane fatty-acyl-phospholipid synthase-like methyltransferase|uniref:class I SAM-dependent methyltransferase n=1 Tax=Nocardioides halotolerans TaxID=433660 RepID=UPI000417A437|nr:class I SAM-dependent methyltransferase [Nocardioides halotolerans]